MITPTLVREIPDNDGALYVVGRDEREVSRILGGYMFDTRPGANDMYESFRATDILGTDRVRAELMALYATATSIDHPNGFVNFQVFSFSTAILDLLIPVLAEFAAEGDPNVIYLPIPEIPFSEFLANEIANEAPADESFTANDRGPLPGGF